MLLKGASIARWLYDDGHVRPYCDIDLLVAPDQRGTAEWIARHAPGGLRSWRARRAAAAGTDVRADPS